MKHIRNFLLALFFIFGRTSFAQSATKLQHQIEQIIAEKQATIGVAISDENGKDIATLKGNAHFPMQSVFKFPVAVTVLHQVDKGRLNLDQMISISAADLDNDLYSPIRDEYPEGTSLPLAKVFQYAAAESDNIATDKLLKLVGGPQKVENYIKATDIQDIAITYNEKEQQSQWDKQFENWITPAASNQILQQFYKNEGQLLSQKSHQFLWETMKSSTTGPESIRGKLPKETVVAHKTGHSGTNSEDVTAAVNDIGIIFLPNEHFFYLSVYVSNSKEKDGRNQKVIADIAKAAWDYFFEYY